MVARTVTLTEAKAKLSELLDAVERGEEIIILRHGERVARLRAYSADTVDQAMTLADRAQRLHESCRVDRAFLAAAGLSFTREDWKSMTREGLT